MILILIILILLLIYFLYTDNYKNSEVVVPIYYEKRKYTIDEESENYNVVEEDLNEKMKKKMLHTGSQAEIINKGQTKSMVDYLRPIFKKELDYYEDVEWWNEDRTF